MAITGPSLSIVNTLTLMYQYEGVALDELLTDDQIQQSATISDITQATNGVITFTAAHPFYDGDELDLSGIVGMTELNGETVTITVINSTSVYSGVDTSAYGAYVSGGTATHQRTGWKKKITAAWNRLMTDLRVMRGLDTDLISAKDSDGTANDVQSDFNLLTCYLALSLIFFDFAENVGEGSTDRYLHKSQWYRNEYETILNAIEIDYDIDEDGSITDGEEDLSNPIRMRV